MRTLRLHTLALLVVSFDAAAVSFDCVKAVSRTEQLICSDPDLGQMDDAVAQAYALARQRLGNPSALVREQRAWLAKRDSCRERNCVKKAYEGRIQQLQVASDAKRGGGAGRVDILAKRANTLPYG